MSLTSILSYSNKHFKTFRELLLATFPTPNFKSEESLKSKPLTTNYQVVGTAFDYLLRFNLEKKFDDNVFTRPWAAEVALRYFNGFFGEAIETTDKDLDSMNSDDLIKFLNQRTEKNKYLNQVVNEKYLESKNIYRQYVNNKLKDDTKLIESTLFLASLDALVRGGPKLKEYINLESEEKLDVDDLKLLINSCDLNLFKPKSKIVLNPTFGEGSKLVGGADADVIVDDTLIDIKVTKELKLIRPHFNQLIGYYLLYLIGGIDEHPDIVIKKLGIYFARYNVLWTIKVEEIGEKKDFDKAIKILNNHLK